MGQAGAAGVMRLGSQSWDLLTKALGDGLLIRVADQWRAGQGKPQTIEPMVMLDQGGPLPQQDECIVWDLS